MYSRCNLVKLHPCSRHTEKKNNASHRIASLEPQLLLYVIILRNETKRNEQKDSAIRGGKEVGGNAKECSVVSVSELLCRSIR